jgi:hypothetical protein
MEYCVGLSYKSSRACRRFVNTGDTSLHFTSHRKWTVLSLLGNAQRWTTCVLVCFIPVGTESATLYQQANWISVRTATFELRVLCSSVDLHVAVLTVCTVCAIRARKGHTFPYGRKWRRNCPRTVTAYDVLTVNSASVKCELCRSTAMLWRINPTQQIYTSAVSVYSY